MAVKLGELLIKAGLITPMDLDEALNSQIIFGGKLGTNLIEMGCIEEEMLARFLSKVTGIPSVTPEQLKSVPPEVIGLVPASIAGKYKIIPLTLANKRLTVAMSDPSDLAAMDEISFATGFIIIPMIASEMTIIRSLEKFYQIKRQRRALRLKGKGRQRERQQEREYIEELPENSGQSFEEPGLIEFPPLEEFKGFHVDEASPVPTRREVPRAVPPPPPEEKTRPLLTPEEISMELAEAKDRDTVAELLLSYAGQQYERAAIFIVKAESAYGWKAMVRQQNVTTITRVKIPLDIPSVLRQVVQEKSFYLGPVPDTVGNQKIFAGLGGGKPEQALLIPLLLLKRVVAVFYLEGTVNSLADRLAELQKLASKSTMALEILILKSKILMT